MCAPRIDLRIVVVLNREHTTNGINEPHEGYGHTFPFALQSTITAWQN